MRRGAKPKPRVCICCGEPKNSGEFHISNKTKKYIKTCKSCGNWLYLFRQYFEYQKNIEKQMLRQKERYHANREPAVAFRNLMKAFFK